MQTKLTLRMDDQVIRHAKKVARSRNMSLSKMVEEKLKDTATLTISNVGKKELVIPEWIQKLGVKKWKNASIKNDPKLEYLLKKHAKQ